MYIYHICMLSLTPFVPFLKTLEKVAQNKLQYNHKRLTYNISGTLPTNTYTARKHWGNPFKRTFFVIKMWFQSNYETFHPELVSHESSLRNISNSHSTHLTNHFWQKTFTMNMSNWMRVIHVQRNTYFLFRILFNSQEEQKNNHETKHEISLTQKSVCS